MPQWTDLVDLPGQVLRRRTNDILHCLRSSWTNTANEEMRVFIYVGVCVWPAYNKICQSNLYNFRWQMALLSCQLTRPPLKAHGKLLGIARKAS